MDFQSMELYLVPYYNYIRSYYNSNGKIFHWIQFTKLVVITSLYCNYTFRISYIAEINTKNIIHVFNLQLFPTVSIPCSSITGSAKKTCIWLLPSHPGSF